MKNLILPVVFFLLAAGSTFAQGRVQVEVRPTVVLNGDHRHPQRGPQPPIYAPHHQAPQAGQGHRHPHQHCDARVQPRGHAHGKHGHPHGKQKGHPHGGCRR